ncbi:MAG: hypothetical protein ACRDV7_00630, partial [Acidimicrobiia bacterium]
TGPYRLDDGRLMLVRAYNRLGVSHFPWSRDVSTEIPYSDVLAAFILDDAVDLHTTDFGTSVTDPQDYLPHVTDFGLFDTGSGSFEPIDEQGIEALTATAKQAQRALYRKIAAMERNEKVDAGAYVYFTFLRPFADAAGVELDWAVPRDSLDLYPFLSMIEGGVQPPEQDPATYYPPIQ